MPIKKVEKNMAIISALSDLPNATDGLSAATFKEKFDEGGIALKNYINDVLIPALQSSEINNSGADQIGATTIADLNGATVQTLLQSIRDRLKATTNNASGADFVSATAIEGLSGNSVQALIRSLKSYVDTRESTGNHAGTWQGVTRTEMVNDYIGRDATLNTRINGIVAQSGNDNTEIVDARGGAPVLRDRLDNVDTQLAQKATNLNDRGVNVLQPPNNYEPCVGDGVTDNTTTIQKLLNDFNYLIIPDGVFITGQIIINKPTTIEMAKGTVLKSIFTPSDVVEPLLKIVNTSNVQVIGGTLDGLENNHSGIRVESSDNVTIHNTSIKNLGNQAFTTSYAKNVLIDSCSIQDCFSNELTLSRPGTIRVHESENITITNTKLKNNGAKGIALSNTKDSLIENCVVNGNPVELSDGMYANNCKRVKFVNNTIITTHNINNGIKLSRRSEDCVITGCYIESSGSNGVYLQGVLRSKVYNNTIKVISEGDRGVGLATHPDLNEGGNSIDNIVENNVIIGGRIGIYKASGAVVIKGNHIKNTSSHALDFYSADNVITGNTIENPLGNGLNTNTQSSNTILTHNKFINCPIRAVFMRGRKSVISNNFIKGTGEKKGLGIYLESTNSVLVTSNMVEGFHTQIGQYLTEDITITNNQCFGGDLGIQWRSGNGFITNNIVRLAEVEAIQVSGGTPINKDNIVA